MAGKTTPLMAQAQKENWAIRMLKGAKSTARLFIKPVVTKITYSLLETAIDHCIFEIQSEQQYRIQRRRRLK